MEGYLGSNIFLAGVDYFARYRQIFITKRNWRRRIALLSVIGDDTQCTISSREEDQIYLQTILHM